MLYDAKAVFQDAFLCLRRIRKVWGSILVVSNQGECASLLTRNEVGSIPTLPARRAVIDRAKVIGLVHHINHEFVVMRERLKRAGCNPAV